MKSTKMMLQSGVELTIGMRRLLFDDCGRTSPSTYASSLVLL